MKHHDVQGIQFEGDTLVFNVDGTTYRVALEEVSERLVHANVEQRKTFRVSPSGYGIHWPAVDEDLSVDGLIRTARAKQSAAENAAILRETHE